MRRAFLWVAASAAGRTAAASTVAFNERYLPRIPGIVGALAYVGVILVGGWLLGIVGAVALVGLGWIPRPRREPTLG